jgi:selenocysteine lyase/cysteine desulfurase
LTFKQLFSRSLAADPGRLHFAAHSHHLWPDASYNAHLQAWDDAARLADRKWEKIMEEVWPAAQAEVAGELGTGQPDAVAFASNTHELLIKLFSAFAGAPISLLTSDGEFHSARRQFERWEESGSVAIERVPVEPYCSFDERFIEAAARGGHDIVFVSHVMFGSGRIFERIDELAAIAQPGGPWVVIDGYHAFMAVPFASPPSTYDRLFYVGGGYKYAMAGEGSAFIHAPGGFAPRPTITGWYAQFEDLSLPPGVIAFAGDARRFLGATFDPSGLYRFLAVRRMLQQQGLTTKLVSDHVRGLQEHLLARLEPTALANAQLLNPLTEAPHARFLAFRSPFAERWHETLKENNCITDVRGDVLRIGIGLYHDDADVERLVSLLGDLRESHG